MGGILRLNFFLNKRTIIVLYLILSLAVSIHSLILTSQYRAQGKKYTRYNNYVIFTNSFNHLKEGKDLYCYYPEEQADLFKYSPSFALFFGVFAALPDFLGLSLWNIINALFILLSIYSLPVLDNRRKALVLITVLVEFMTSIQNQQSNALIAGLIIFSFRFLEDEKYFLASLAIVATFFIKIFGIVALSLFLFYPQKWKLALYTVFWFLVFFLMPLLVVDLAQLKFLYGSWKEMLAQDHSVSEGLSVIGWLKTWFHLELNKTLVTLAGGILFCLPLLRLDAYRNAHFRTLMLCSVLIWVVIFNHKAESPTFIIAMCGVAIWFYASAYNPGNLALLLSAIIFTSLSVTDLFPRSWENTWVIPYTLKAVPCILIWVKILYELLTGRYEEDRSNAVLCKSDLSL